MQGVTAAFIHYTTLLKGGGGACVFTAASAKCQTLCPLRKNKKMATLETAKTSENPPSRQGAAKPEFDDLYRGKLP
jgi:hypothetical protein